MTAEQSVRTMRVLVVEDNPVDVELLRLALDREETWPVETVIAEDGEAAISLLNRQTTDPAGRKPDLILLDLNVPKKDGTEVLRMIRRTSALSQVPVAILSSSPGDVIQNKLMAAQVAADGYFTKPNNIDDFLRLGSVLRTWYEQQGHIRR
jgi:CheY-like chemotaxis protein